MMMQKMKNTTNEPITQAEVGPRLSLASSTGSEIFTHSIDGLVVIKVFTGTSKLFPVIRWQLD
jgi:hypothetical protein